MSLELTLATEHSGEHSDLSQVKPELLPDFTEEPLVLAPPQSRLQNYFQSGMSLASSPL